MEIKGVSDGYVTYMLINYNERCKNRPGRLTIIAIMRCDYIETVIGLWIMETKVNINNNLSVYSYYLVVSYQLYLYNIMYYTRYTCSTVSRYLRIFQSGAKLARKRRLLYSFILDFTTLCGFAIFIIYDRYIYNVLKYYIGSSTHINPSVYNCHTKYRRTVLRIYYCS